tara:strand:- start:560 stop:826 length:267 start_codon:yes stop_codon:yes gene_type:complete
MCVVSMVTPHIPEDWIMQGDRWPNLIKDAYIYDKRTNQKDCYDSGKDAILKEMLEEFQKELASGVTVERAKTLLEFIECLTDLLPQEF